MTPKVLKGRIKDITGRTASEMELQNRIIEEFIMDNMKMQELQRILDDRNVPEQHVSGIRALLIENKLELSGKEIIEKILGIGSRLRA